MVVVVPQTVLRLLTLRNTFRNLVAVYDVMLRAREIAPRDRRKILLFSSRISAYRPFLKLIQFDT